MEDSQTQEEAEKSYKALKLKRHDNLHRSYCIAGLGPKYEAATSAVP
jgi:hypothetical protein